jgi:hypothetical protein
MASLMKKLFDTMPLAGAEGALRIANGNQNNSTIGQLARHLEYIETLAEFSVTADRPSQAELTKFDNQWNSIPIWGYDVPADPARVKRITCRVRDDNFNNYVVLDQLEWGYAPVDDPTSFRDAVQIVFQGTTIDLPLSEEFRLMTFATHNGENGAGLHWLWPIDANHDPSLLHVFAYDLQRSTKSLVALKSPDHPEMEQVTELINSCRRLEMASHDNDDNAWDLLFKDNLWDTSFVAAAPAGTVPESVELSMKPVRILVACSLTVCRERDDFQPGRPMGAGRLFPHVMVVATTEFDRVNAAVRLSRPSATTRIDGTHCSCDEMADDPAIRSLLVTDANEDSMVLRDPGVPFVQQANLFNYYVPDPFSESEFQNRALPIIRRSRPLARSTFGLVNRDCSDILATTPFIRKTDNQTKVTKFPRQGMFDNVHLAPRMKVTDVIDHVDAGRHSAKFTSSADWKMDIVMMAPLCAHDCFHMHWRWGDADNGEQATYGWGANLPNEIVGRVMVPANQDVFLVLSAHWSISYLAGAEVAKADSWQVFCHHGAGYSLSAGPKVSTAKVAMRNLDNMSFMATPTSALSIDGNWALFFWRLRYCFKRLQRTDAAGKTVFSVEPVERFSFTNRAAALDL